MACGIAGVRWSSSLVAPEILGHYSLLVATHLFGVSVTHQGFIRHAQRYWTRGRRASKYAQLLLGTAARPTGWLAIGLAGVTVVLYLMTQGAIGAAWWPWMLAINLLTVIAHLIHAALQAEERYWSHFALSTFGAAARSFLPLLLASLAGASLAVLAGGFAVHAFLWALVALCFLGQSWQRTDAAEAIESPQGMLTAFMGVGMFAWLAGMAPRWFAALALNPETTGYFMLAMNLAMFVPTSVSLIGHSYSFPPLFAAGRAGADDATLSKMTQRTVGIVLLVGQTGLLALAAMGPLLVGAIVHPRYAPSMDWLLPAGGAALANITSPLFCNALMARNRADACLRLTGWSAGFRVALVGALALVGDIDAFRWGLGLLAWPTAILEWWLMRRLLQRAASK